MLKEDKHFYSVPYRLVSQQVKLVYSAETVEIYYEHQRVAFHVGHPAQHHYTTLKEHLPATHQWFSSWSPAYFTSQAEQVGPYTQLAIEDILRSRSYPEQAYRSCAGVLSLERPFSAQRLERACERALLYQATSYKLIRSILERELDRLEPLMDETSLLPTYENIPGATAYQ
jgi:hypothetical protein